MASKMFGWFTIGILNSSKKMADTTFTSFALSPMKSFAADDFIGDSCRLRIVKKFGIYMSFFEYLPYCTHKLKEPSDNSNHTMIVL